MIDTTATLSSLVRENPSLADALERLGLDYCCGGKQTLAQACRAANLDPGKIARELEQVAKGPEAGEPDWSRATLRDLIDHIVGTHHVFLRQRLPPLHEKIRKIAEVHGASHPELLRLREIFGSARQELESHLECEEEVIFPRIKSLERGGRAGKGFADWLRDMEHDHQSIGDALHEMRRLTSGYRVPPDACATYETAMTWLAALESDTHRHVHKENNILIPGAEELARSA